MSSPLQKSLGKNMKKLTDMIKNDIEERLEEDLKLGTLLEGSSLYLHGFDEEIFPDALVCPYCGEALKGSFRGETFFSECDCEDYKKEIEIRKNYIKMLKSLENKLKSLSEKAKISSFKIIQLNKNEYLKRKEEILTIDLALIKDFTNNETN